mmetsp:Transcript_14604/g.49458  ORF Transcript_14604/g.49458 Transcript_14604/m.49458 type:complete len:225 (+) Transcript_14604:185-859(+)
MRLAARARRGRVREHHGEVRGVQPWVHYPLVAPAAVPGPGVPQAARHEHGRRRWRRGELLQWERERGEQLHDGLHVQVPQEGPHVGQAPAVHPFLVENLQEALGAPPEYSHDDLCVIAAEHRVEVGRLVDEAEEAAQVRAALVGDDGLLDLRDVAAQHLAGGEGEREAPLRARVRGRLHGDVGEQLGYDIQRAQVGDQAAVERLALLEELVVGEELVELEVLLL